MTSLASTDSEQISEMTKLAETRDKWEGICEKCETNSVTENVPKRLVAISKVCD